MRETDDTGGHWVTGGILQTTGSRSVDDCFDWRDGGGFVEGGAVHLECDEVAGQEFGWDPRKSCR